MKEIFDINDGIEILSKVKDDANKGIFYCPDIQRVGAYCDRFIYWLKDYKRLLAKELGTDIRCGNCKHDGTGDNECESCYFFSRWEEKDV